MTPHPQHDQQQADHPAHRRERDSQLDEPGPLFRLAFHMLTKPLIQSFHAQAQKTRRKGNMHDSQCKMQKSRMVRPLREYGMS
jgi:hypothetical protein